MTPKRICNRSFFSTLLLLFAVSLLLQIIGCSVSGDGEIKLNQKIEYEEMPFPIYDY